MNTSKKRIVHLAKIAAERGIEEVVFSPGSRCAPLVIAFNKESKITCRSIVDERSAAFFALGMAQQSRKTVALVCTSGSAALNYAPAIAEALYQEIPLLILTADRPSKWIDQGDMQTIRQNEIYENYIKGSFTLPESPSDAELMACDKIINEAISLTQGSSAGPVHINIPLNEPLYEMVEYGAEEILVEHAESAGANIDLDSKLQAELKEEWQAAKKKFVLVGLMNHDPKLQAQLETLSRDQSVVVFTETTSNLHSDYFLPGIDRMIDSMTETEKASFQPDLVITLGGYVVSKKVKLYLRKFAPKAHWHIHPAGKEWNTFEVLSRAIEADPKAIFANFLDYKSNVDYNSTWLKRDEQILSWSKEYLASKEFCDFIAFQNILENIPEKSQLQLGSSTPVRYSNLFNLRHDIKVFSNRGVGGIDGVLSTAVGAANKTDEPVCLIMGDLTFGYDSNGLWNNYLPKNLKVVVINNGGGNIFRIIPGPKNSGHLEDFFETKTKTNISGLAKAFGVKHFSCKDETSLKENLADFWRCEETAILEVVTDGEKSAAALRDYFPYLRNKIQNS